MARISKPPEERRQEILDTAMRLFTERGYEETSMADIAREMDVVQGLCYRYFDSKQKLFHEAMGQYVRECCAAALPIIHDRGRTIAARMDAMAELTLAMELPEAGPGRGERREGRREERAERRDQRRGRPEGEDPSRRFDGRARYREFYHRPENRAIHDRLSMQMCDYLLPHVAEEFRDACARGELRLEHPEVTASYLLHAQVGLMGEGETPMEARVALLRRYAELILNDR